MQAAASPEEGSSNLPRVQYAAAARADARRIYERHAHGGSRQSQVRAPAPARGTACQFAFRRRPNDPSRLPRPFPL